MDQLIQYPRPSFGTKQNASENRCCCAQKNDRDLLSVLLHLSCTLICLWFLLAIIRWCCRATNAAVGSLRHYGTQVVKAWHAMFCSLQEVARIFATSYIFIQSKQDELLSSLCHRMKCSSYLYLGTSCVGLCYSSGPDQGLGPDFNAPTTTQKRREVLLDVWPSMPHRIRRVGSTARRITIGS